MALKGWRCLQRLLLTMLLAVAIPSAWSQSQTCLEGGRWLEVDGCASPTGTIYDNGGPDNVYANNFEGGCVIMAQPGMTISLSGNYTTESAYDRIFVYDGYGEQGSLLVDGVSGTSNLQVSSTTGFLSVKFVTDNATQFGGFALQYVVTGRETVCGNAVTGLSVSSVTQQSAVLDWSVDDPLRPLVVLLNGTAQQVLGSTLALTNLAPGRHYDVVVVDSAHAECPCCYVRAAFHTLCADSVEAPMVELFDDYGSGVDVMPDCWTRLSNYDDASNQPQIVPSPDGEGGILRMYCGGNSVGSHFSLVVGPVITSDMGTLQGRLKLRSAQVGAVVEIGFCVGTTLYTSQFVPVDTLMVSSAGVWEEFMVDFSPYAGVGRRLALRMLRNLQGGNGWSVYVDDVTIEGCGVQDPLVFNRSHRSLWLMWDAYGNGGSVDLEYGPRHFVPGTGVMMSGVVSPCRVAGLEPATDYEFRLTAHCGGSVSSLSYLSFEGRTLEAATVGLNYCEGFESCGSSFPQGWRLVGDDGSGSGCEVQTERSYRGQRALRLSADNAHPLRTLVLPVVDTTAVAGLQLSMRLYPPAAGMLVAGVMESPENPGSFTPVDTLSAAGGGWSEQTVDLSGYEGTGCWIALRLEGSGGNPCYIDDLRLARCMITGVEVTNITMGGLEVRWDQVPDSYAGDSVRIVWGAAGFDADTAQVISVPVRGTAILTTGNQQRFFLTGLEADSDYELMVYGVCDAQVNYCEGERIRVHTLSHALVLPYCEGFESGDAIPEGWLVAQSWGMYPRVGTNAGGVHGGSRCLQLDSYGGLESEINTVALPLLESGDVGATVLSFHAWSECGGNRLEVGVMEVPGNTASFTPVATLVLATGQWRHYAVPLEGYAGNGRYVALRKYTTGNCPNGSRLMIDDLVLNGCQTTNIRHRNIDSHSVTVLWDSVGSAFDGAVVEIGRSGFVQGEGNRSGVVRGGRLVIDTLSAGTTYEYYVHPQCEGDSAVCNSNRYGFSTLEEALRANWCFDFESQTSSDLPYSWRRPRVYNGHPQVVNRPDNVGGRCVRLQSTGANTSMLVFPPIEEDIAGLRLRMRVKGSFDTESDSRLVVGFVADSEEGTGFEALDTIVLSHSDFRNYTTALSTYTGEGRCVALIKEGSGYAWVDDVAIGRCFTDSLRVYDITDSSAVVTWSTEDADSVVVVCSAETVSFYHSDTVTSNHCDTLMNLQPGTEYRVQVTALCSGVVQYCSNETTVFATTVFDSCASDCSVAGVTTEALTDSSLTLRWNRSGYVGTTYIAYGVDAGFSLSVAVHYATADTVVQVEGLTAGTTYRFCLWGACQDTLLICQAVQITATMPVPPVTPPDTSVFVCSAMNPTEHSIDLGCNAFPEVDTVWVEYRAGVDDFTTGSGILIALTDSVYTLTGLEEGTDYTFHFFRPCSGAYDSCGYLTLRSRTLQSAGGIAMPWCEDFENTGINLPSGWHGVATNVTPYPAPTADIAFTGNRSLEFYARPDAPCVAVLPPMPAGENDFAVLSFYAYVNSVVAVADSTVLRVGVMSDPADIGTFVAVDTLRFDTLARWKQFVVDFAGSPVTHRYVAIRFAPQNGTARCYIDKLLMAHCAVGDAAVRQTDDSVAVSWMGYHQPDSVVVEYGLQGFLPGTVSSFSSSSSSSFSFSSLSLSPGNYDLYITPYCSDTVTLQCQSVLLHFSVQDTVTPPVTPPDTVTVTPQQDCPHPHLTLVNHNTVLLTVDSTNDTVDYWVACCAGDTTVIHVTQHEDTITSLQPNTLYRFLMDCDSATLADALVVTNDSVYAVSLTTGMLQAVPYCENFDGNAVTPLPMGWRSLSSSNAYPIVSSSFPFGGTGASLQLNVNNAAHSRCLAILPELDVDSIGRLWVSFQLQTQYPYMGYLSLEVGVMSDPADAATFVAVDTVGNMLRGFWPHQVSMAPYTGDGCFLALRARNTSGYDRSIFVDNLIVETCHIPSSTRLSLVDHNKVMVCADEQTETGFYVEYDTCGFVLGTGHVIRCDSLPLILTLDNETSYDFYFSCDTGIAACSRLQQITTLSPPIALPYCLYPESSNQSLSIMASAGTSTTTLLPSVDVDSLDDLVVSLYLTEDAFGILELGVMREANDTSSFIPVATLQGTTGIRTHLAAQLRNLPADVRFLALRLTAGGTAAAYQIDNINLSYCGAWDVHVASMESDYVAIDWQQAGNPVVSFEYGPTGFAPGTGTWVQVAQQPPYLLTGLASLTAYDICFHAQCRDSSDDPCGVNYHHCFSLFTPAGGTGCIDPTNLTANYTTCYYGTYDNPRQSTGVVDYGCSDSRSRHTIHYDTTETDLRTGGILRTIPPGSQASVRLGNWNYNAQNPEAESVEYSLFVDPDNFDLLILKYAAVLQDPLHAPEDQPRFSLEILDENHNPISQCASADFRADYSLGWNLVEATNVLWKDWTTVGIDMSSYANQTVFLRLTTYDCNEGSHYGYAYFTLECSRISMRTYLCGDVSDNTFSAPSGFLYHWYTHPDSIATTTFSTAQTVTLPTGNRTYYCDCSFIDNPDCRFTLSAFAGTRYPLALATPTVLVGDCRFYVSFANGSTISSDGFTPLGTDEPCETAQWWFGNGDSSTNYNASTVYFDTGNYEVTLVSGIAGNSCTDTLRFSLRLDWPQSSASVVGDSSICMGDSVVLQAVGIASPYWSTGDSSQTLVIHPVGDTLLTCRFVNTSGCNDSLGFAIAVHNPYNSSDTVSICEGDFPFVWGDTLIYADSVSSAQLSVLRSMHSVYGCDSIATLQLFVKSNTFATVDDTIVENGLPYSFHHHTYTTDVMGDTLLLINQAGCDSVITYSLYVYRNSLTVLDTVVCSNALPMIWNGQTFYQTDTRYDTLLSVSGADSVLQMNLVAIEPYHQSDTVAICFDDLPYTWRDTSFAIMASSLPTLLEATAVQHNLEGCDSVFVLHLTVNPVYHRDDTLQLCRGELPYSWNDTLITDEASSGIYVRTISTAAGCDSIVSLHLTVNPDFRFDDTLRICRNDLPFSWRDTLFAVDAPTGYYERRLHTEKGCDSVLTLDLHINDVYQFTDQIESCTPITWIDGLTYGARTYGPRVTLTSQSGCDSIITLDFRLLPPSLTGLTDSFCANSTYTFAGRVLDRSGIYYDTLQTVDGCDSILQLALTRLDLPSTSVEIDADCEMRGYWLTVHSDVDYHHWSLPNGHWNTAWSPQNSTYLWVSPSVPIELTLTSDYIEQSICPSSQIIPLNPVQVPQARMHVSPEQLTEEKDNFNAYDRSSGAITRVWWIDDVFYGDDEHIWCRPDVGLDSVTVMLISLSEYCNDTAIHVVHIYRNSIYAPNAFTPEQENNREFLLLMDGIVDFELSIYNRAGLLLFHTTDRFEAWDGTYNGKPCLQDSYVWIVRYTTNDKPKQPQTLKGTVTLLR